MMSLTRPVSGVSNTFSYYFVLLFDLLELVSCNELYLFNYESDDGGSGSGSPGTCSFPFFSDEFIGSDGESVGLVCGMVSVVFVPTGIESIGDDVLFVVLVSKGVDSKGG